MTRATLALALAATAATACAAGPRAERPQPIVRPSSAYADPAAETSSSVPAEDPLPPNPTLADYWALAETRNPDVRAADAMRRAAAERPAQMGALPDPELSYAFNFPQIEEPFDDPRNIVSAMQRVPWFGKLDLRAQAAEQAAAAAAARYEAARLRVRSEVAAAYAESYFLGRSIEVTRETAELVGYWERVARAKFRVGAGGHADVIRAQVEQGRLADRIRTLEDQRAPTLARLNETVGRRADAPLPLPDALPPTPGTLDEGALAAALGETNPELRALDAEVLEREREIDVALKDYWPDLTFGVEWMEMPNMREGGRDSVFGRIGFTIPLWWEKYAAAEREARARRLAAAFERESRGRAVEASASRALFAFRDAARKIDLFGAGLVPKARQALDAIFTAYEAGKADFLDVLDAQRALLEFRLEYERALADRVMSLAEIEMLVGRPVALAAAPASSEEQR